MKYILVFERRNVFDLLIQYFGFPNFLDYQLRFLMKIKIIIFSDYESEVIVSDILFLLFYFYYLYSVC